MGRGSVVWIVSDGIKDEIRVLQGLVFDLARGLVEGGSGSELPSTMGSKIFCGPSAGGWPLSRRAFRADESDSGFDFNSGPFCEWDRKEREGRRVARRDLLEVILG